MALKTSAALLTSSLVISPSTFLTLQILIPTFTHNLVLNPPLSLLLHLPKALHNSNLKTPLFFPCFFCSANIHRFGALFFPIFLQFIMATIVCQGLQSCLESQLVESRTLRLRLSSTPKPHFSRSLELALKQSSCSEQNNEEISDRRIPDDDRNSYPTSIQNPDVGFWSFFQDLPNGSFFSREMMEKENGCVHPKGFSSSILSEKSLELCTENLGNETGTIDVMETSSIFSSSESESEGGGEGEKEKGCQNLGGKKAKWNGEFPPPLTTMRGGAESLQVRSHREDGRLIIKAIKTPLENKNFQAERSEGRLRLRLFKDSASNFDLEE